jgi:hypothetical protein
MAGPAQVGVDTRDRLDPNGGAKWIKGIRKSASSGNTLMEKPSLKRAMLKLFISSEDWSRNERILRLTNAPWKRLAASLASTRRNTRLIPERILAIIRAFLNAKKTGKMILNIKDGQIMVIDTQESVRL